MTTTIAYLHHETQADYRHDPRWQMHKSILDHALDDKEFGKAVQASYDIYNIERDYELREEREMLLKSFLQESDYVWDINEDRVPTDEQYGWLVTDILNLIEGRIDGR